MTRPVYFFSVLHHFFRTFLLLTGCLFFIFQTSAQQIIHGNKPKPLGAIIVTPTIILPTCNFYNGAIILKASGGTPPYIYNYEAAPFANGYFPGLRDGRYYFYVSDATGATVTTFVTIPPNPNLLTVAVVSSTDPTGCGKTDGTVTLAVTGGTPPYQYSSDNINFQSSNILTNLPATPGNITTFTYPLYVVDANGCTASTAAPALAENCSINVNGVDYTSSFGCNMLGRITVTDVNGGVNAYTYSIDGINFQQSSTFDNLQPGFYKLYIKNSSGVIDIKGFSILSDCPQKIIATATNNICGQNSGSITVTSALGIAPYTYSIDGINFQTSNVFNNLAGGYYNVAVRDIAGNINFAVVLVTSNCPVVTATETDAACNQNTGTITATGSNGTAPYQYSIDGINFQSSNVFNNLSAGNYTVTIKDAGNFTTTYPITINNNCLQLAFADINTICSSNNGSITATASGGIAPYTYSIDGINFQTNNVFNNLTAGNYSITVKDANNVTAASPTIINDAAAPKINVAVTQASCSNINGAINITATGGTSPLQFSINNGASFQSNNIFNNLDSAQYIALIKDANGCTVSDTVQLTAPPTPVVFIGNDTTLCTNATLLLSAPQVAGYQYLWQDNSTANSFKVATAGTYIVKVTNQFNCSATASVNVNFMPVPNFNLGVDTSLCNGKTILLQPTVVLLQASYLWNTGATSFSIHTNNPGTYWLQVSNGGCAKRDSIIISSKPNPLINFGSDTTLCEGQTLLLDATNNNATYTWQDGSTGPTFNVNSAGTYSVDVAANGCDTVGKINVVYTTKPIINLGNDTSICITQSLLLNASYPQSTYVWQDGSTQPQFNVTQAGTYSADVTNACGDTKDSINVVFENCACRFYVPSAFSPNSDGKNDVFTPKYQCAFSNYELKIFNRWGQLVFNSNNVANGWDGNFNNQQQPTGSYVWELNYKDNLTGKQMHKNGTLVLVR